MRQWIGKLKPLELSLLKHSPSVIIVIYCSLILVIEQIQI